MVLLGFYHYKCTFILKIKDIQGVFKLWQSTHRHP